MSYLNLLPVSPEHTTVRVQAPVGGKWAVLIALCAYKFKHVCGCNKFQILLLLNPMNNPFYFKSFV